MITKEQIKEWMEQRKKEKEENKTYIKTKNNKNKRGDKYPAFCLGNKIQDHPTKK